MVIAFGAGVLVSALTFDLMGEAFERETGAYAIAGFLVGAVIYVLADAGLERLAARSPKRTGRDPQDVVSGAAAKPETPEVAATTGLALLVGALIDGIPRAPPLALACTPRAAASGSCCSRPCSSRNVPESLGSVAAMRQERRSRGYIIGVWTTVAVACVLATMAGYALLAGLSPGWVSAILALAAGGILALLADTMFPEAFEHGGRWVALATAVGFACAFLLSELTGSA